MMYSRRRALVHHRSAGGNSETSLLRGRCVGNTYPTLSGDLLSALLTNHVTIRRTDIEVDFRQCVTKDLNRRCHLDDDSLGKSPWLCAVSLTPPPPSPLQVHAFSK